MSEQNRTPSLAESISALVDNQASELELQRILKASEEDSSVKESWARYQVVSSVLRGERIENVAQSACAMPDFAARISVAVAAEDQHAGVPTKKLQQGFLYQLGRIALVASVAGGMIVGVQQYESGISQQSEMAANTVIAPALPSGINAQTINTRTVALQSGYESRPQESRRVMFQPHPSAATTASVKTTVSDEALTLYVNQMIQAHSDNAVMNSNQGVLPYARVIVSEEE